MDDQMINTMAAAFAKAMRQTMEPQRGIGWKAPATTPTGTWIHGPGGIFAGTAVDKPVISLRIAPRGISSVLRAFPSPYTNPEFAYITGVIQEEGQEQPSDECSTCVHGITKSCVQTAQFGRLCVETKTLTVQRALERVNRMDIDYDLVNDMFGPDFARDFFAGVQKMSGTQVMQVATAWAMVEAGVVMQNLAHPLTWTGNPINSIGTGYMEPPGLDILIGTNKVDAHTGTTCPALYSDVKDFGHLAVNSVDAAGNFRIVRFMEYMEAYLYHNAERQNLLPAQWAIVMRPELWYELSMIWPTAWMTTRNVVLPAGNTNFLDATRIREMVQEMQSSMTIWLNGRRHPVILDDGILEYTPVMHQQIPAGSFASNIYFLPLTYLGNNAATFYEHLDFRAGRQDLAIGNLDPFFKTTDDGRFQWTSEVTKFCYTISAELKWRIVLLTPQLAGRINYVLYTPLQHFRSWDPSSVYFFDGGEEDGRPAPSLYSDWNLPR
jgi:hypothetical protein